MSISWRTILFLKTIWLLSAAAYRALLNWPPTTPRLLQMSTIDEDATSSNPFPQSPCRVSCRLSHSDVPGQPNWVVAVSGGVTRSPVGNHTQATGTDQHIIHCSKHGIDDTLLTQQDRTAIDCAFFRCFGLLHIVATMVRNGFSHSDDILPDTHHTPLRWFLFTRRFIKICSPRKISHLHILLLSAVTAARVRVEITRI